MATKKKSIKAQKTAKNKSKSSQQNASLATPFHKYKQSNLFQFIQNMLLCFALIALVYQVTAKGQIYNWFYESLLKANLNYITGKKGELTLDQKYELKLGYDYKYLNFVKERTPEDAVILMPLQRYFLQEGSKAKFRHHMGDKGYTSFFLYPRQVVYEKEKGKNPLYEKVTHVAIVNKCCYDKLNYPVRDQPEFTVLPINNGQ